MKTETIHKGNQLIDKINKCEAHIEIIEKIIEGYKKWADPGNHDMNTIFSIGLNFSQGGWKEYRLDFEFVNPLYLMKGYLENVKTGLVLYKIELKDLQDE